MIPLGKIKATENFWKNNYSRFDKLFGFGSLKGSHLDFGSGLGFFVKMLAAKNPGLNVFGEDIDSEAVEFSKKNYKLSNLGFAVKNNKKYNSISLFFVIHEINDAKDKLKELYSQLNDGGILIIYDFRKVNMNKFKENYRMNKDPGKLGFDEEYREHNRWSMKQFEEMCLDAGFKTKLLKTDGDFWLVYKGEK